LGGMMGGVPGAAIGATVPWIAGRNRDVDEMLEAANFLPSLALWPKWMKAGGPKGGKVLNLPEPPAAPVVRTPSRIDQLINARNSVYHATDLEGFKGILEAGEISPNPWLHTGLGKTKVKELMKGGVKQPTSEALNTALANLIKVGSKYGFKEGALPNPDNPFDFVETPYFKKIPSDYKAAFKKWDSLAVAAHEVGIIDSTTNPSAGVSVSRVPRIKPKAEKAISFVIDRSKMPRNRGFAESGYEKTQPIEELDPSSGMVISQTEGPNPRFEFEDRTYNEPIPLSAVKGVMVDESALAQHRSKFPSDSEILELVQTPEYLDWAKGWSAWTSVPFEALTKVSNDPTQPGLSRHVSNFLQSGRRDAERALARIQLNKIQEAASAHNLPVKVVPSGRAMHGYRAGLSQLPQDQWWGVVPPAIGASLLDVAKRYLEDEQQKRVLGQ
jgi:hypothetical protein